MGAEAGTMLRHFLPVRLPAGWRHAALRKDDSATLRSSEGCVAILSLEDDGSGPTLCLSVSAQQAGRWPSQRETEPLLRLFFTSPDSRVEVEWGTFYTVHFRQVVKDRLPAA
jgi:hypothetical protein